MGRTDISNNENKKGSTQMTTEILKIIAEQKEILETKVLLAEAMAKGAALGKRTTKEAAAYCQAACLALEDYRRASELAAGMLAAQRAAGF